MQQHWVIIDKAKCVGCGLCAGVCPTKNIALNEKRAAVLSPGCLLCGHCFAVCPKEAISIRGYETEKLSTKEGVRFNPEDVLNVIRFRRSVRRFQERVIPEEAVRQILEAGRLTHTAKNLQDVSFVVLDREKERIERLAVRLFRRLKPFVNLFDPTARRVKIDDRFFFFGAPVAIVVYAKDKADGLLAAQNMEFVAEANGLGVLFSGFFTTAANLSPKLKRALQRPRGKKAAATLVLGYPKVKFLRSAPREKLSVRYM